MRQVLRLGSRALALAGLLAAFGAGAVAVAGQGGRWSGLLDVANHFTPVWGAAGLASAALCALACRGGWRRAGVAAGLVAAVIAAIMVLSEITAGAAPAPAAHGPTLKLVQFNLWEQNVDPAGTAAWILAQDADVVMTEETVGAAAAIGERLEQAYPYRSSCRVPRRCSVMIYSRLPLTQRGSGQGPPLAWAVADWNGRPLTLAAIHAFWPYPPGFQQWQMRRLARFAQGRDQAGMILAGDFNAAPWAFGLKRLDRSLSMQRRTHGAATWPAAAVSRYRIPTLFPVLAIDQVYAGSDWRTVRVERGPRLGSDHYPVVVELAWAD